MASVNLPNVEGMTSIDDLRNAVGKMVKELSWLLENLDTRNVNELNAEVIVVGSITAEQMSVGSVTAEKIDVDELSAITANMGKLTSGEIYGAYIATKEAAYPRAELSSTDNLIGAFVDALNAVTIVANDSGSPALDFISGGVVKGQLNTRLGLLSVEGRPDVEIFADAGKIYLRAATNVIINGSDFSKFKPETSSVTLQDALNAKATKSSNTSTALAVNGGIPIGTVLMVSGGGTVTWSGVPAHSHTQN
jgi:hypothetical protein